MAILSLAQLLAVSLNILLRLRLQIECSYQDTGKFSPGYVIRRFKGVSGYPAIAPVATSALILASAQCPAISVKTTSGGIAAFSVAITANLVKC